MKWLLPTIVLLCWTSPAPATEQVPEDARRHVVRGLAAVEIAKTPEGFRLAVTEFQQAVSKAPDWPEAHLHLAKAMTKAGDLAGAIASYRRYVALAPDAADAAAVGDEIIKIEFLMEQAARVAGLAGQWGDYRVEVSGSRFRATGTAPVRSVVGGVLYRDGSTMHDWSPPMMTRGEVTFDGEMEGSTVSGVRRQPGYLDESSNCAVPASESPFTGTLSEGRDRLVLRYPEMTYRAEMADDATTRHCRRLSPAGVRESEAVLIPDHVQGGIGVMTQPLKRPVGRYEEIFLVEAGSPAEQAGLGHGDVILAIDGADARDKSVGDHLRGTPGTTVALAVERNGERREVKVVRTGPPRIDEARLPPAGVGVRLLGRIGATGRPGPVGEAVIGVVPEGPAAQAGLASGDVIVAVDGKPVRDLDDAAIVGLLRGDESAPVVVEFRRASATRTATIVRRVLQPFPRGRLGFYVFSRRANKDGTAQVIIRVAAGTPAEKAGLPRGDRSPFFLELVKAHGLPLSMLTTERVEEILDVAVGEAVRIEFRRPDASSTRSVTVVAGPRPAGQ